jgi:type II secretory pathway component PulF
MEFTYEALDTQGKAQSGIVNAVSQEAAIASLQAKGFTITAISNPENAGLQKYLSSIPFFTGVSNKDVVMLSRQISTLFEAQVSALRVFRMLSEQAEKPALRAILADISDSLQAGSSISESLTRHQDVFSSFYVNMVRAGEESGKLDQTFQFLADYIERSYELTSKARNALVYPAFIMATFVAVMTLMLTVVIPKIGEILEGDGQQLPVYTRIILGLSHFFGGLWHFRIYCTCHWWLFYISL